MDNQQYRLDHFIFHAMRCEESETICGSGIINYTTYWTRHLSKAYNLWKLIGWFYIASYNAEFVHQYVEFVPECIKELQEISYCFLSL